MTEAATMSQEEWVNRMEMLCTSLSNEPCLVACEWTKGYKQGFKEAAQLIKDMFKNEKLQS